MAAAEWSAVIAWPMAHVDVWLAAANFAFDIPEKPFILISNFPI